MKHVKKLFLVILCIVIITATVPNVLALKNGDKIGDVLYSDITAYINGSAIPTSIKNGTTMVVVEDLANYGFDVKWDGKDKTLKVELNTGKKVTPLAVEKNNKPVGTFKCKYVYTDIKTYLSGQLVESFAIEGRTLIDFELLSKYGNLTWNGTARTISLSVIGSTNSTTSIREDFANGFIGTTVVAGEESSFAIQSDGSLWAWGNNAGGRLGDGTVMPRLVPVKIMDNVSSVHNFGNNTMAITTNGDLYSWGLNDNGGILGNGTTSGSTSPTRILDKVDSIHKFGDIMMAITKDGDLWGWGLDLYGVINPIPNSDTRSPVHILGNVIEVFSTGSIAIVRTADGGLWTWGLDTNSGRLGQGVPEIFTPGLVRSPAKVLDNVTYFTFANDTTFAITTNGNLWGWGMNFEGRLGIGASSGTSSGIPVKIFESVASVYMLDNALINATMIITTDNRLWAWGSNNNGLLGDGTTTKSYSSPILIMDNVAEVIPFIGKGYNSVNSIMVIKSNGELWGWGANRGGGLMDTNLIGDGTTTDRSNPVHITDNVANLFSFLDKTTQHYTKFLITTNSRLEGWGYNAIGQLGDGTTNLALKPLPIMNDVVYVFSPFADTIMAITADGSLWGWGSNSLGQLGDGTTTDRYTPVRILSNVVDISYSSGHIMVITSDGNLWSWGNNRFGQLGDDTATPKHTPVRIMKDALLP